MDIVLAAAIGWFFGAIVLWRYMLRLCDDVYAKLRGAEDILEGEGLIDAEDRYSTRLGK